MVQQSNIILFQLASDSKNALAGKYLYSNIFKHQYQNTNYICLLSSPIPGPLTQSRRSSMHLHNPTPNILDRLINIPIHKVPMAGAHWLIVTESVATQGDNGLLV